jgi:hypothetical protein
MGREANCVCDWNGTKADVKALIEPPELILRRGMRRCVPIAEMKQVRAEGGRLRFKFGEEVVALELGNALASKWAEVLLKPPPGLAKKLGITAETTVWMIGKADDDALKMALAEAKKVSARKGDLILASVETPKDLQAALAVTADELAVGVPIWFIYRKGSGHALHESTVRAAGLAAGVVDTKAAAVSQSCTALRFVKRKT